VSLYPALGLVEKKPNMKRHVLEVEDFREKLVVLSVEY
jgi:hypothetical protein